MVDEGNGPVQVCVQLTLASGSQLEDNVVVTIIPESGVGTGVKCAT